MKRIIEIPISNDMKPNKSECFEIELTEPTDGAILGQITKMAVTITNDEGMPIKSFCWNKKQLQMIYFSKFLEFNSVFNRLAELTHTNVTSMQVHQNTWAGQIKDAMNVNGGDIENASTTDYVMHFFTFGWKVAFLLFIFLCENALSTSVNPYI